MATSQIYWVLPDNWQKAYSGVRRAEVIVGRKWVKVRLNGQKRFSKMHLTKWLATPHVLAADQTIAEIANALRHYEKDTTRWLTSN